MKAALRVGLAGFGLGGSVFHAPLVAATPGLELCTVMTRDPKRADRARRDYPGVRVVERPDELWAGNDLAVITTPNSTHVPLARSALDAGLSVVIDKPIAARCADARDLAERAEVGGLMLTAFQNRRWDSDFLTLRKVLEGGELGDVFRFESRYERWEPEVEEGAWRERSDPDEAGGALYDLGSHLIDQALQLFGPAEGVYGEVGVRRPGAVVDDDSFVAITHRSGVVSHLWMSLVAAELGPRFRVLGTDAAFVKHGLDVQEDALAAGGRPGGPDWGREPEDIWGSISTDGRSRTVESEPGDYSRFYAGVVSCLHDGAPPPVAVEDAIAVIEVIEAALSR